MLDEKSIEFSPLAEKGKIFLDGIKKRELEKGGKSFGEILNALIKKVNELEKRADEYTQQLITGEIKDIHQVMIAAEEASVAFNLMMEIRNKLIEAYKEIMRMQI